MKKIILLALVLVCTSLMLVGCGKQESKIGYVDVNRVVAEAPKVKALNDDYKKQMETLTKERQELVAKQKDMKPEEFQKKVADLQGKMQTIDANIQGQFTSLINPVYADVLSKKELSIIIRKQDMYQQQTVEYGGIDVTDDVIEKLK